jgi:hypothetical protein
MSFVFSNEARSALQSAVESTDTTLVILTEKADRFAEPTGDDVQRCIIRDDTEAFEIVDITSNPLDGTLTVDRGVEGTSAQDWPAGAIIEQYMSAAVMTSVALSAALAAIGSLTPAANKIIRYTDEDSAELLTLTNFGASILDDANEAAFKATVNLEIGTDVQAWSTNLDTYAANSLTSGELTQLRNIDSVTISNTRWGYLGAATSLGGQVMAAANAAALATLAGLGTGNSPTFNDLTVSDDLTVGGDITANSLACDAGSIGTTFGKLYTQRAGSDAADSFGVEWRIDGTVYAHAYVDSNLDLIFTGHMVAKSGYKTSVNGTLSKASHGNRVNYINGNVTVPASGFTQGDFIILVGDGSVRTLTQGGGGTQTLAGTSTTGNLSIAINGIVVIIFDSATSWKAGGNVS